MSEFPKPKVLISKCIEFEYCRWNGNKIRSPIVNILKSHVEFKTVCAEVEIGLGVPRDPIKIIKEELELKLIQPKTRNDYTEEMLNFANEFLNSSDEIDGIILKSHSPSCGIFETKYFHSIEKGAAKVSNGPGIFGREVLNKYPKKAIETEGRLTNFRIREHWLIKLFTLASFRELKYFDSKKKLIDFQTKNKFLFLSYNQELMRQLGRIAATPLKNGSSELIEKYEKILLELLFKPPKYTAHINTLLHILGYFKNKLTHEEKAFFLDELEKYRAGWIPLFILINLIYSWIARFDIPYLAQQSYLNPYPEDLMNFDLRDSWRGRSYWNK